MLSMAKRAHRRPLLYAGLVAIGLGLVACAVVYLVGWTAWWANSLLPVAGTALVVLWVWCVRRFDPNAPGGTEPRRAVGKKRAEEAIPTNSGGVDYIAGAGGTIDVRYMVVYPVQFQ
jgi:hypothetical protein